MLTPLVRISHGQSHLFKVLELRIQEWISLTGTLLHLQGRHLHQLPSLSHPDQLQEGLLQTLVTTPCSGEIPAAGGKALSSLGCLWCSSQHCKYQRGWCSSSSCPFCQPALLAAAGNACWLPQLPAAEDSQHSTHRHRAGGSPAKHTAARILRGDSKNHIPQMTAPLFPPKQVIKRKSQLRSELQSSPPQRASHSPAGADLLLFTAPLSPPQELLSGESTCPLGTSVSSSTAELTPPDQGPQGSCSQTQELFTPNTVTAMCRQH